MKITERSGFLSANDEKRTTRSTARTPFAKWGRAGVDSLPDLLSSDRSAGWVSESTCRRGNFMCTRRTAPSVASPLLHGIKRSAFTQERERFGCARSVARYIGPRESTLAHNISFERSSYGSPSRIRYHLKLRSTSYYEHAYETLVGRSGHDSASAAPLRVLRLLARGRSKL